MKKSALFLTLIIGSLYLQSCSTKETDETENLSKEQMQETMAMEEAQAMDEELATKAPVKAEYKQMEYVNAFPLVDTILKYSSDGRVNYRLTQNMTALSKELTSNLGDKASVMQYGEGIIVALDQGDIFEKNGFTLNENAKDILRYLAYNLQKNPDTYIMVAGRADSDGKNDKNDKLAYKRAAVAANYLHGCGIDEDRFFVDSYGEKYPDYRNNTKFNMDKNRRVDFLIIPSNQMREDEAI
jgi:outer membrane protein OmpA-like peptidoglycan-associated protein